MGAQEQRVEGFDVKAVLIVVLPFAIAKLRAIAAKQMYWIGRSIATLFT